MAVCEDRYFILDAGRDSAWLRFRRAVQAYVYRGLMDVFRPQKVERTYNVSICTIFKNEAPYLKEWIEFHRIVGVDHFYLYNNNSEDEFRDILAPYLSAGIATLVEWPRNQAQMEAYWHCVDHYRTETRWLGFIDIDEFVVPRKMDTIYEFLQKFDSKRPVVKLYWRLFGSSGRMDRPLSGLVTEDFTVCAPKYMDIGKVFYNTTYEPAPDFPKNAGMHHTQWARCGRFIFPPVNMDNHVCIGNRNVVDSPDSPIQINHYFTKSYEEYRKTKQVRGDVMFEDNPHDMAYFFEHEKRCMDVDFSAYRFLIQLKQRMMGKKSSQ